MKCPSKEIDKNKQYFSSPAKPQYLNSLFENQHSLGLFVLVVLWCFCSPWRSGVFVSEQADPLRDTVLRDLRSAVRFSQAKRLQGQSSSQTLGTGMLTHRYAASAFLLYRLAVLQSGEKPPVAGCSFLELLKIHVKCWGSFSSIWVGAHLSLDLQPTESAAQQRRVLRGSPSGWAPGCWESSSLIHSPSGDGY